MEQQRKKRSENWSAEEKEILRQLIAESRQIIEDKSNKTSMNILKNKEWKSIALKLSEITGKSRSDSEIKLAWKRMKLAAKSNLSKHRQQLMQTGGGEKPPSPAAEDLAVMAIAPQDFMIEVNDYDSDAVIIMPQEAIASTSQEPSNPIQEIADFVITEETVKCDDDNKKDSKHIKNDSHLAIKYKTKKKTNQIRSETIRESILQSNIDLKKKQVQIMEEEHSYNIKIAKLKITKLELEIEVLKTNLTKKNNM